MLKENDLILVFKDKSHKYLIKLQKKQFHTDKGFIDLSEVIGKKWGHKITTNLGESFYILKPTLENKIMKVKRKTQIIYPKDIGIILLKGGIFPGAKVIECGCGSAALTTALAHFVRPEGKVYSFERRKDLLKNAMENIEKNGLINFVEFEEKEITDDFPQKGADFIMIDIGSPWELIPAAYRALKQSGRFCAICPSFEQLMHTVFCLEENNFIAIESLEVFTRYLLVRKGKSRPEQRMPSHTGFLIFATKV